MRVHLRDVMRGALTAVATQPGRSAATALTILVAVASTIAVGAISRASQAAVVDVLTQTGSGQFSITAQQEDPIPLTVAEAVLGDKGLSSAALTSDGSADLTAHPPGGSTRQNARIVLLLGGSGRALGLRMSWGAYETETKQATSSFVLVGRRLAADLQLGPPRSDLSVWVDGTPFTVLGVFDEAAADPSLVSALVQIGGQADGVTSIFAVSRPAAVAEAAGHLVAQLDPTGIHDLTVNYDSPDLTSARAASAELGATTVALILIGSVVTMVVVGSLAAVIVTQRSREIAIRRTLGATPLEVAARLVVEVAILSVFGATLGVVAGATVTRLIVVARGWVLVPALDLVWIGLVQGTAAGLVGVSMAAVRSSRLDPAVVLSRL